MNSLMGNGDEGRPPAPPVRVTSRSSSCSSPVPVPPSPRLGHRLNHPSNNAATSSSLIASHPPPHHIHACFDLQQLKNVINGINSLDKPLPKEPDEERKKSFSLKNKTSSFRMKKGKNSNDSSDMKPVISTPTNFEHTVHVGFDSTTGEFTGIPASWTQMLKESNISKSEREKNPQAVIDVLSFFDSTSQGQQVHAPKFMTLDQSLGESRPTTWKSHYRLL